MTTKEEFQKDKKLCKELASIVNSDHFKKCLAYARAALFETDGINSDMLRGAREFEKVLTDLPNVPSERVTFSSGVDHALDNPEPKKPE